MIARTAINRPVHFIDIDRKISSMDNIRPLIEAGEVTFWELDAPLVEETLAIRATRLAKNEKPTREPAGWKRFAALVDDLDKKDEAKRAGTWAIDSLTQLGEHAKRMIIYTSGTGSAVMSMREWGLYKMLWAETITILRDEAKSQGKDVIFTVHERVSEVPLASTRVLRTADKSGNIQREYLGPMELKIAASIEGAFGIEIGTYFEEFYGLSVDVDREGKPQWVCRVLPDGKRDLRTSFTVKEAEFAPDFREIWKNRAVK
jgi:hypothetical protein